MLCVALGVAMNASANEDKRRESRYPPAFYTFRATESKEPGSHRMRIDNRTLEITLPETEPQELFMPEAVRTNVKSEAYEKALLNGKVRPFTCFHASWQYGLLFINDENSGGIGASVKVMPHTRVVITDPSYSVRVGTVGNVVSHRRSIELDYFELDDFIRTVNSEGNTDPYWVEVINGRKWVREVRIPSRWELDEYKWNLGYGEKLSTPLDRNRILTIDLGLSRYYPIYAASESVPGWMEKANKNIEAVLRSIKLSPPDDGSPDPFLIDPEQKPGTTPIVFPASRPYPAPPPLAKPGSKTSTD
jgi:hypothetical protein